MRALFRYCSLAYFQEVLAGKVKTRPFTSLLALSVLLSIYPSWQAVSSLYPLTVDPAGKVQQAVDVLYPEELVVTITDGRVETNVTEPYYITVSDADIHKALPGFSDGTRTTSYRVLTIDTNGRAEDFERYQSMALLTETSFVYYSDDSIKIQPLREVGDITIDKSFLDKFVQVLAENNIETWGKVVLFVLPFLVLGALFVGHVVWLMFLTLFVYIMARIHRLQKGIGLLYRYTVAIAIAPKIVQGGIYSVAGYIPSLSLIPKVVFDVFILVIAYVIVKRYASRLKKSTSAEENPPEHGAPFRLNIAGDLSDTKEHKSTHD